jgi:hypothetical protein
MRRYCPAYAGLVSSKPAPEQTHSVLGSSGSVAGPARARPRRFFPTPGFPWDSDLLDRCVVGIAGGSGSGSASVQRRAGTAAMVFSAASSVAMSTTGSRCLSSLAS